MAITDEGDGGPAGGIERSGHRGGVPCANRRSRGNIAEGDRYGGTNATSAETGPDTARGCGRLGGCDWSHQGNHENTAGELVRGVERPEAETIWSLQSRTLAPRGRGGATRGTPDTGDVRSNGKKILAPMPREWERAEGAMRPKEWKTQRGRLRVTEWSGKPIHWGEPKPP